MNSKHPVDELSSYVSGELNDSERSEIERHVYECAECAEVLRQLQELDEVLNQSDVLEPSPSFAERVMASAQKEHRIVAFRSRRTIAWLAVAASIVFVVFVLSIQKENKPAPAISTTKPPVMQKQNPPVPRLPSDQQRITRRPSTTEDPELIANLDVLENMDLIENYDNLEYLDAAVITPDEENSE